MELYKKYRPTAFSEVIGNKDTVTCLQKMVTDKTLPHTILLHGPSGCGKTTLARILKEELECGEFDFHELNCSDFRGIDTIRDISSSMHMPPSNGKCRIWLLDEVHQMTKDGQNAALKILEDTPRHVYFILCTTDPKKLLPTIKTRCSTFGVEKLSRNEMKDLIKHVAKSEKIKTNGEVAEAIVDAAEGSPRMAVVLLDKVSNLPVEEQEQAVTAFEENEEVIALCRVLLAREPWKKVCQIVGKVLSTEEPETIRYAVLGYMKSVLLKKDEYQAYHVITCFENHFYDSKAAGVIRACYESVNGE